MFRRPIYGSWGAARKTILISGRAGGARLRTLPGHFHAGPWLVTAPVLQTSLRPTELLDRCAAACARLKAQVAEVVIGQEQVVDAMLVTLLARGHALLVGVPGLAK